SKPQYQIYGKIGYIAYTCYHITNLNYQSHNTSSNITAILATFVVLSRNFSQPKVDNNWYIDLGGTHHFISEFGNLTDTIPFPGVEQAMVGNGPTHEEPSTSGAP
ncbi:hypothetical protein PanWU01x14_152920, partial [Parasponia andersonii]